MNKLLFLLGATALLAATVVLLTPASSTDSSSELLADQVQWTAWKSVHSRAYTLEEEPYRFEIFRANLKKIAEHNQSGDSFQMALNKFADMSHEEFVEVILSEMDVSKLASRPPTIPELLATEGLTQTANVDWVSKNVVGPVNDQGRCGSCWAFSAVEAIQSAVALATGAAPPQLSEEQLVQCSRSYGNEGCNGGWPYNGMEYVSTHLLATEQNYPYTSFNGATGSCNIANEMKGSVGIKSFNEVQSSCSSLQNALNVQPVSVCVDATNWQFYSSGVFSNCSRNINHAVLLVGSSTTYWNIQNSWGTSWGEGGYIRLAPGDTCGVCEYGAVATA